MSKNQTKANSGEGSQNNDQDTFDVKLRDTINEFGQRLEELQPEAALVIIVNPKDKAPIVRATGHYYQIACMLAAVYREYRHRIDVELDTNPRGQL